VSDHAVDKMWWYPIGRALDGIKLNSLRVVCPRCKESGLITTRWIKGPALKPLYILHIKWGKVRKVCGLNQEQASLIRGRINIMEKDIEQLVASRRSYILFSGGILRPFGAGHDGFVEI